MKTVILAGGEGTRLRPLTVSQPKPMLPVANRPLLEHTVAHLRRHGFVELVMALGFRAEVVRDHFGNGTDFGVRITYAIEEQPLGTAGAVRHAIGGASEPFLVVSGDVLTDMDLRAAVDLHGAKAPTATVVLQTRANPLDFGMVVVGDDGTVERFVEKPTWDRVLGDAVNTGIYVLDPDVFDLIPPDRPVDFAGEVFPHMIAEQRPVYGCTLGGYWEDVGTVGAYIRANLDVLAGRVKVDIPGFALTEGIWLGEEADVDPDASITGPAVVGSHARVDAGAVLGPDVVLGSNVRVNKDVSVERSIVHDNVYLGQGARLRGTVVGRGVSLHLGARVEDDTVLGEDSVVGEQAVINPGVAVYPAKTVDAGAVVDSSIIWESKGSRHLFGPNGVTGLANVDVTPELAVRLAMAFATTLPRGASVAVSRDTSRAGRVLLRAMTTGLNAAGVDVLDLDVATVPVTRFAVGHERSNGGATVRLVRGDPQSVAIRLFGPDGIDLDDSHQKQIERIFERRDVRRSLAAEIGELVKAGRVAEDYTAAVTTHLDVGALRAAGGKVVLDYSYGSASFVMPNVLAKLGVEVLSVNPYASTRQAIAFDRAEHAREVARLVVAAEAGLGAVIDADGERLIFVDDRGHILSDEEGLLAVLRLVLDAATRSGEGFRGVALPVAVRQTAVEWCRAAETPLHLTAMTVADLLEAAATAGFGASLDGGYVFPSFLVGFDAIHTLVAVLALLADGKTRLSEVLARIPAAGLARSEVAVPWEWTGPVMRALLHDAHDREVVLVDGVKVVHADGWALVVPDAEAPFVHVWAEAESTSEAEARVADYVERVRRALAAAARPSPGQPDSGMFSP